MAIRITCPSCKKSYNVDDALGGKKVRCRECKEPVSVPAGSDAGIVERKPPGVPAARRARDDDDDERPSRKSRRRANDDDDDDEDERPRRKGKKKPESALPLVLIGGGVGVVVLVGVVVGLVFRGGKNEPVAKVAPPPAQEAVAANPAPALPQGQPQAPPAAQPNPQTKPAPPPKAQAKPAPAEPVEDATGWNTKIAVRPTTPLNLATTLLLLPDKSDFFEGPKALTFSAASRRAALGYQFNHVGKAESRVVLCDLAKGAVIGQVTMPGTMLAVALSDDGTQLVMQRDDFGFGTHDRLELWDVAGKGGVKKSEFHPYKDLQGRDRDLVWCAFLDDKRLATVNTGGKLIVWDFPACKQLSEFTIQGGCVPTLSADRKMLAFTTGKEVGLYDLDTAKILALQPSPNHTPFAVLAFSPNGQRLACAAFDRIFIWDVATGKQTCEVSTTGVHIGGQVAWTSDRHILLGGKALFDIEMQIRFWDYSGPDLAQVLGGLTWFVIHDGDRRLKAGLVPVLVPHPAAEQVLQKASADPDFIVLRPGAVVNLDVSGLPDEAERDKVAENLTARLRKNGCEVAANGTIELIASADIGNEREIQYYTAPAGKSKGPPSFFNKGGLPPGAVLKSARIVEHYARLKFVFQGQSVWEQSALNIPRDVQLEEGETMQEHLRKRERPNYAFYQSIELPRLLLRAKGAGTLGTSPVTMAGVR